MGYDEHYNDEVIAGLQGIVDRTTGSADEEEHAAQAAIELIECMDNHVRFLESELDDAENRLGDEEERV